MFQPPLVPADLVVPEFQAFDDFALAKLVMERAGDDYALVDANRERLIGTFGPDNPWPRGTDARSNLADVAWHEVEFGCRTSFAYWIVDGTDADAPLIGCVYVAPSPRPDHQCAVYFWLDAAWDGDEFVARVHATLRDWLEEDWGFAHIAFPGREIPWEAWAD
jgi:RimJ/RimL family protein N-acetyltransferase